MRKPRPTQGAVFECVHAAPLPLPGLKQHTARLSLSSSLSLLSSVKQHTHTHTCARAHTHTHAHTHACHVHRRSASLSGPHPRALGKFKSLNERERVRTSLGAESEGASPPSSSPSSLKGPKRQSSIRRFANSLRKVFSSKERERSDRDRWEGFSTTDASGGEEGVQSPGEVTSGDERDRERRGSGHHTSHASHASSRFGSRLGSHTQVTLTPPPGEQEGAQGRGKEVEAQEL